MVLATSNVMFTIDRAWLFLLKIYTLILFIIDLDECKESEQTCHSDADCINNIGSYLCRCKDGYLGNGVTCVKGEYWNIKSVPSSMLTQACRLWAAVLLSLPYLFATFLVKEASCEVLPCCKCNAFSVTNNNWPIVTLQNKKLLR